MTPEAMRDAPELLPCPFCASTDVGAAGGIASCYGCQAQTTEYIATHYAIAAWNKRTPIPPAAAQDALKLSGLRGMVKTDKSSESIVENSHKQWNDQSAGHEKDKPVAWWNGISERNSDFNTVPSWALKEDTNHDIPLYAGYNPESEYANKLSAANARADEAERAIEGYDDLAGDVDNLRIDLKAAEQSLAAVRELLAVSDGALEAANRTIEWQIKELAALKREMG